MRYRQCRNCGFWVIQRDRFCSNCGTYRPFQSGRPHRSLWLLFTTVLGGVLGGSVFYRSIDDSFVMYGFIAGCLIGLGWGLGLFAEVSAILLDRRRSPSLQSSELHLLQRLADIERARRRMNDLSRQVAGERPTDTTSFLTGVVGKAEDALSRANRRYRIELAKLELIRWRNKLDALAASARHSGGFNESRGRITGFSRIREEGNKLLDKWRPLEEHPDAAELVDRLRRSLDDCSRIIERLLTRQAHNILTGVAAYELVPPEAPPVEAELSRIDASHSDVALDEIDEVQHALDQLDAKEALDQELRGSL